MLRTIFQRLWAQKMVRALPNLLTVGNLCLGVAAILLTIHGDRLYEAFFSVLAGMLLDGLDGKAARMFNTESSFGERLDSLSDVITFGVAPGVMVYAAALDQAGPIGVIAPIVFIACGAVRLARFHTQPSPVGWFKGLPIPAAGAALAALSLEAEHEGVGSYSLVMGTFFLAFLMVSTIRYTKIRRFRLHVTSLCISLALLACLAVSAVSYPGSFPRVVLVLLVFYIFYGIARTFRRRFRGGDEEPAEEWK
ncbi:CDP-diacylglycerol--serine O-phosphatidyltransferase [Pasteuria penetrans]|uniref:CDP-diacylglycerol--serine O-phosphatidyltransferase n=1 Tax=Pasteuria penetrans TaxID=86005 RepID=UPI000FAC5988|nr:CDP-diacylglycerol--serine O-phosphatidyltransferase [Pasteuria penetrans]